MLATVGVMPCLLNILLLALLLFRSAKAGTCAFQQYTESDGPYKWFTKPEIRQLGQSYFGDRTRLLSALQRYKDGGNLTIAITGGSIAAGQGAIDAPNFPKWMINIISSTLDPTRVKLNNGAVPGTVSSYMAVCHNVHVPKNADIVFVEYAVNDEEMPMPHMDNRIRRPYEKLLRKLMNYPNKPAIIILNAYRWFHILPTPQDSGTYWTSSERQQAEFAWYYHLPMLSIKACCHHLMQAGVEGYQVAKPRADMHGRIQPPEVDVDLKGKAFYYDIIHPDGHTGHRVMGELGAQLILDAWAQVQALGAPADAAVRLAEPLRAPMIPKNYESKSDKCFIGTELVSTVLNFNGFEYKDEARNPLLPKLGYVSDTPGSTLRLQVNTQAPAGDPAALITVELAYLRSYENMGRMSVQCESGCTCDKQILEGHHEQKNSQTFMETMKVTQADKCVLLFTVMQETSSGKHKCKLSGVMVSEESNDLVFNNWAAVDYVNTAVARSKNGIFDISNAVRRTRRQ